MHELALEPGQRIGRYRVIGVLGRGGMGGVLEVVDDAGERYALKSPIMDVGGAGGEVTRRFAREANVLRLLEHPNLVAAVDVFIDSGQLFLVMEKVAGRTLGKAIAAGGLGARESLVVVRQVLDGVGYAHGRGLVHRDLKPDNILLLDMGGWERVKIIDFGIVKLVGDAAAAYGAASLTRSGTVSGTPLYMAPEQALGRPVDGRADLYAIGVMTYELLAGAPPFKDPDPYVLLRQHVKVAPPPLPEAAWNTAAVRELVAGALAKDREQRFPDAAAMIAALDAAFVSLQ